MTLTPHSRPYISVVSPVYGCKACLQELCMRLKQTLSQITPHYEIILVNDGSPDGAWETLAELAKNEPKVVGIKLSRNFGQHYAITAGLDHAKGDWVVVMDCDLQDQPEEILKLYAAKDKADIILASRHDRQDSLGKRMSSAAFYKVLSYLTGANFDPSVANFGLYSRKVIEAVCSMRESIRVFPVMVKWVGFGRHTVAVEHAARAVGQSSYNWKRLLMFATDIMLAYSDKPLRLTVKMGFVIAFTAAISALIILVLAVMNKIQVVGYASLIISIWFFSGLIVFTLGIMGLYLGKIFDGVKHRPIYIISDKIEQGQSCDV